MESRVDMTKILWKLFGNCNFQRIFKGFYSDFKIFSCLWAVVFDNLFCVNRALRDHTERLDLFFSREFVWYHTVVSYRHLCLVIT